MYRSVAFALSLLLSSLAFVGCGSGISGTGPGGNNNGGNTVGMTELPIFAVCYQTRQQVEETCSAPLRRATGQQLPTFGWKFEARTCDTTVLLYHAETSEFTVFWDGLKVQFPKQGCIDVTNTINTPQDLNGSPQTWIGTKRIENTATFDTSDPPRFRLIGGGGW